MSSLDENYFQKLANTEFLERFKKDYEGGTNYYSVEEITIEEVSCNLNKASSTNKEYYYSIKTFYVVVKFKDISNEDVLLERSTHIIWNTDISNIKEFEEELYLGIKRLIVFG